MHWGPLILGDEMSSGTTRHPIVGDVVVVVLGAEVFFDLFNSC